MKTGLASNCQSRFFNTNVDPLQKSWTHTAIKHAAVKKIAALIASYLNAKSSFLTISAPALKALSFPLAT